MYPHIHWDDCPDGSKFEINRFKDGPNQGHWGIVVRLPDDRRLWVSLGDPAEVVTSVDQNLARQILINLSDSTAAIKNAAEAEVRVKDLPDPQDLPMISWEKVTPDARLQDHPFRNGSWGVVAVLQDGEYLVVFDRFAEDSGYHTFSRDRDSARLAIAFLESALPSAPPFKEDSEDLPVEIAREMVEADLDEIETVAMGWLFRLYHGKRKTCICGSCRHEYNRRLDAIMVRYEEEYGFVPSLILNAVDETLSAWKARENVSPPVNWYRV